MTQVKICGKCGQRVRWVDNYNVGVWVHADTGLFMSNVNGRHDANTHVTTPASEVK